MPPTKREIKTSLELLATMTGKKSLDDAEYLGHLPRKCTQHEAKEMQYLFDWVTMQEKRYPELELLYHIPNERKDQFERMRLGRQGVRRGVPDLCLPVAKRGFHGLYIELKAGKNKATKHQDEWLEALRRENYNAQVCIGWHSAADCIMWYLGIVKGFGADFNEKGI